MYKLKCVVIIINHNTWYDTIECVRSLGKCGDDYEILIIDNASHDNSYENLTKELKGYRIIRSEKNLGFSGANNFGISLYKNNMPKYFICLNNDTIVKPDALEILINEMDRNSSASLGTGQIMMFPDTNKFWYNGGTLINWRGLAVHFDHLRVANNYYIKKDPIYINFISGCYICIRSDSLEKLGLWNEKFFLYLEDIELSARAVKKKLKLLYVPGSVIYHKWNGIRKYSIRTLYYAVRNRNLLIDESFGKTAKIYFFIVIRLKLIFWFFFNKPFFHSALKGLRDYKNKRFGEISSMEI